MKRWLIIFRSHADGPADEHFVGVYATSPLGAIVRAKTHAPPLREWRIVRALAWPAGCSSIDAAVKRVANAR